MSEGNRRQAAIIFVIAGVFLVGLLLVGFGIVKQQSKNIASGEQTNQPVKDESKNKEKADQKPTEQAQPENSAPTASPSPTHSGPPVLSPNTEAPISAVPSPQTMPATGPTSLPATGSSTDFAIGMVLITVVGFAAFRFLQSKQALQPKL